MQRTTSNCVSIDNDNECFIPNYISNYIMERCQYECVCMCARVCISLCSNWFGVTRFNTFFHFFLLFCCLSQQQTHLTHYNVDHDISIFDMIRVCFPPFVGGLVYFIVLLFVWLISVLCTHCCRLFRFGCCLLAIFLYRGTMKCH